MPYNRFWVFSKNIDRIRAEENLINLEMLIASRSKSEDNIKSVMNGLKERIDLPTKSVFEAYEIHPEYGVPIVPPEDGVKEKFDRLK